MAWYIPVLIFCARILDVSIGTVRTIFVIGGRRYVSAALGFVEVIVWALAVGGVIKFLNNPVALLAYGGGYATGTLVGMTVEQRLAIGHRVVQIINRDISICVSTALRQAGFRVTRLEGSGRDGPVEMVFCVVKRRRLGGVLKIIRDIAPQAFVSIERADHAGEGSATPGVVLRKNSVRRYRFPLRK